MKMSGYICPKITVAPAGDLIGEGYPICDEILVGEGVSAGDVLYFKSDGKFWKADADGSGMMPCIAIAMQTKGVGVACKVLFKGVFRNDAWNWTAGQRLYVSTTAGAMTATQPTTGESQYVAVALSADVIYFNPALAHLINFQRASASVTGTGGAMDITSITPTRLPCYIHVFTCSALHDSSHAPSFQITDGNNTTLLIGSALGLSITAAGASTYQVNRNNLSLTGIFSTRLMGWLMGSIVAGTTTPIKVRGAFQNALAGNIVEMEIIN